MNDHRTRTTLASLTPQQRQTENWLTVETSRMSPADRDLYERRRSAIIGYMRGDSLKILTGNWDLSAWEVRRLRDRCLEADPFGRLWGFRALVPRKRIVDYLRTAGPIRGEKNRKAGQGGLLTRLFREQPTISDGVYSYYLKKRNGPQEPRMPIKSIHKRFIALCREAGVKETEYPFNVKYLGIRSLATHLRLLLKSDLKSAVLSRFGVDAARTLSVGTGEKAPQLVSLPLQRVEFDGHKIDALFLIRVPLPGGGSEEVVLHRLWVLAIEDLVTRAILGWHLSFNLEYTKEDVLRCVRNAIEPCSPIELTIPNLAFHPQGGMPSSVMPEMKWAVWAELMYDNGKSNLSKQVRDQIAAVVNCAVNAGPVGSPERRGEIEALFRGLAENCFHRLPNTTGADPWDTRRVDPEQAARKYGFTLDHLIELLHVTIANYNGRPHPALCFRSPLEMLRFYIEDEKMPIRHLHPDQRGKTSLLDLKSTRVVRGKVSAGRRPYIQFEDERYTSPALAHMPELVGTELSLVVDTEDLRVLHAFLPDGTEIGPLGATGKWSHTRHSLATRRTGNRRRHLAVQHFADPKNIDPVHALLDHLGRESIRDKRASGKHEAVRRAAGLAENYRETMPLPEPVEDVTVKETTIRCSRQAIIY